MTTNFNEYCIEKSKELQEKLLEVENKSREEIVILSMEKAAYTQLYSIIKNAVKCLKVKSLTTKTNNANIKRSINGVGCEFSFKTLEITLNEQKAIDILKLSPSINGSAYSVDITYNNIKNTDLHIFREDNNWFITPRNKIGISLETPHAELNKDSAILLLGNYFYRDFFKI